MRPSLQRQKNQRKRNPTNPSKNPSNHSQNPLRLRRGFFLMSEIRNRLPVPKGIHPQEAPHPAPSVPAVPLSRNPTVPQSRCPTVPLSHCPIVPLSHCPTVPLSHCPTVPLSHCPTVPLSHCPAVPLFRIHLPTVPKGRRHIAASLGWRSRTVSIRELRRCAGKSPTTKSSSHRNRFRALSKNL